MKTFTSKQKVHDMWERSDGSLIAIEEMELHHLRGALKKTLRENERLQKQLTVNTKK